MSVSGAMSRLRRGQDVESTLKEALDGTTFSLPILETDVQQELRLREDYPELQQKFYLHPETPDLDVDFETVSYTITDISFVEATGLQYRTRRALNKSALEGQVVFDLDFGDERLDHTHLNKPINVDDLPYQADFYWNGTEMTVRHKYQGIKELDRMFFLLNRKLALEFSAPNTIEELRDEWINWEVYNEYVFPREKPEYDS